MIVRHSFRGKRSAPVLVTSAIGACVPIWGTSTNVSHSERRLNRLLRAEINTHGDNVWHPSAVARRKGGRSVLCGRFLLAHPPFDGAFHSCRGVEGEGCPHLSIHMIRRNTRGMVVVPPQDGPPYVCVRAWTRAACDDRVRWRHMRPDKGRGQRDGPHATCAAARAVVDRAYAPREAARVDTDTAHLRLAVRHTHTAVDEHVYRAPRLCMRVTDLDPVTGRPRSASVFRRCRGRRGTRPDTRIHTPRRRPRSDTGGCDTGQ